MKTNDRLPMKPLINHLIAPAMAGLLIFVSEWFFPEAQSFILLLYAIPFGVFFNGRISNLVTAGIISAYVFWSIPDQPLRAGFISGLAFLFGFGDHYVKGKLYSLATLTERLRNENTRQTEEIRRHNKLVSDIELLGGEIKVIVRRIEVARGLLLDTLENFERAGAKDDIRLALHKLNEAQTFVAGYEALARDIEAVKQAHDEGEG